MGTFLGISKRFEPEGSGEFYCKVCDGVSSFLYLRARPYLYVAFLPLMSFSDGRRVVQCRGCNQIFPESVFDEGSPLIFLSSVLEADGSVRYWIRNREMELPVNADWALGCWFDGLWYPVALGRKQGERQLALFGGRGCIWLAPEFIAPMDIRVGDLALVAQTLTGAGASDEQWHYHEVSLLTWEPDFRQNVVQYQNRVREVVTRWRICFQRPIRPRWKPDDRVLAYRHEGAYFPGTVRQVLPRIEIQFDDGAVLPIRFRLIEPLDLPPNTEIYVRNHNGSEFANGRVVSWQDKAVAIRLRSGEMDVFGLDRLAVPTESFMPSDSELRTFFESPAGPVEGGDWSNNTGQLSHAIQVAGRTVSAGDVEERVTR